MLRDLRGVISMLRLMICVLLSVERLIIERAEPAVMMLFIIRLKCVDNHARLLLVVFSDLRDTVAMLLLESELTLFQDKLLLEGGVVQSIAHRYMMLGLIS